MKAGWWRAAKPSRSVMLLMPESYKAQPREPTSELCRKITKDDTFGTSDSPLKFDCGAFDQRCPRARDLPARRRAGRLGSDPSRPPGALGSHLGTAGHRPAFETGRAAADDRHGIPR